MQHHFETKAGLIKAVDDYVMSVVFAVVAQPVSAPPKDSVADMGSRITTLIIEHPEVVDYFGRALVDGSPLGITIFDTLAAFGTARWNQRKENGEVRDDIDLTWATLNSLVLALGTLILRGHIERQVPDAFSTPAALRAVAGFRQHAAARRSVSPAGRRYRLVGPLNSPRPQPFYGRCSASPRRTERTRE